MDRGGLGTRGIPLHGLSGNGLKVLRHASVLIPFRYADANNDAKRIWYSADITYTDTAKETS